MKKHLCVLFGILILVCIMSIVSVHGTCESFANSFTIPGNYVTFGNFPQTENDDDYTPIEWLVLDYNEEQNRALLISRYTLMMSAYSSRYTETTWEESKIRNWLNNVFPEYAFTTEELAAIPLVTLQGEINPDYNTDAGNDTQDKIFLLSISEVQRYFSGTDACACGMTDYCKTQHHSYVYHRYSGFTDGKPSCSWWLRSPGRYQNLAANVSDFGYLSTNGEAVDVRDVIGVRPALYVDLSLISQTEKIASGKGWNLDIDGCLHITGDVVMKVNEGMIESGLSPWEEYKASIKSVVTKPGASINSGVYLFSNCENLITADFSNLDTSSVRHMWGMFYNCCSLTSLDVTSFDTSNVETMRDMFALCSNLVSIDISCFDTSNVVSMQGMFADCSNLTSVTLCDIEESTYIDEIFADCNSLKSIIPDSFSNKHIPLISEVINRDPDEVIMLDDGRITEKFNQLSQDDIIALGTSLMSSGLMISEDYTTEGDVITDVIQMYESTIVFVYNLQTMEAQLTYDNVK